MSLQETGNLLNVDSLGTQSNAAGVHSLVPEGQGYTVLNGNQVDVYSRDGTLIASHEPESQLSPPLETSVLSQRPLAEQGALFVRYSVAPDGPVTGSRIFRTASAVVGPSNEGILLTDRSGFHLAGATHAAYRHDGSMRFEVPPATPTSATVLSEAGDVAVQQTTSGARLVVAGVPGSTLDVPPGELTADGAFAAKVSTDGTVLALQGYEPSSNTLTIRRFSDGVEEFSISREAYAASIHFDTSNRGELVALVLRPTAEGGPRIELFDAVGQLAWASESLESAWLLSFVPGGDSFILATDGQLARFDVVRP